MSYFPMFIELKGRRCLVVGGGQVAYRKVKKLLKFGAEITVISPEILPEILAIGEVACQKKQFEDTDIGEQTLVVAASNDKELNHRISGICRKKKIWVNAVDQIEDCSFLFPAFVKEGEVVAAFSSGGQSPVTSQYLKERMQTVLTPQIGEIAACLGSLRAVLQQRVETETQRKQIYRELLELGLKQGRAPLETEIADVARQFLRERKLDGSVCPLRECGLSGDADAGGVDSFLGKAREKRMEERSKELFEAAKKHIPGGVNSPVRAFSSVGRTPRFLASAHGDRVVDVDGNELIDYVGSYGPAILGHAHPAVIEKVKKACENGLTFGAPTEREVILAELIAQLMPSMEVSRLVSSGTEAVMSVIRVARGYTKRDKIIKFKGCYHGHSDGLLVKAGSGALTASIPDSAGVPADVTKHTLVARYNDRESIKALFSAYPDEIAAVIVEPVAANMGVVLPEDGFLEFLREITAQYGALLIFDEVITGFRLALGGAQEYFQITPDLTALGKIVGGGMPIGAYGGRREIMELVAPSGPVYQAGTLSGNPAAVSAGIETLRILKSDSMIYERLNQKAKWISESVKKAAGGRVCVNQIGSLIGIFFAEGQVKDYEGAVSSDPAKYADYFSYLLDRGIYVAPSQFEAMFVSDAHTEEDIERTCKTMASYFLKQHI